MKWHQLCAFILLLMPTFASAQETGRIDGVVRDSVSKEPLSGVTVLVVNTTIAARSDTDGRFTLRLPAGAQVLRAQRIGFAPSEKSATITAGGVATIEFLMSARAVMLDPVVAVGYGTQRRSDLTGSVTSVNTDALQSAPIVSVDQLLAGTAPGVAVSSASNAPGGGISVRVRGNSSITGNAEPLYVIDGFPIENDLEGSSVGDGGRARTVPANPLATLNPNDIESIQILKDASATSIYGARGANGVVIINTRQGAGVRPQVTFDYYAGLQQVAKTYDMLDANGYMNYANEWALNSSLAIPFPDSVRALYTANTDWQDEIFRNAGIQSLQMTLRGATAGTNRTRYALSGGLLDQDGIIVGSGIRRLSGRANVSQRIGQDIEVGLNVSGSRVATRSASTDGQQNKGAGVVSGALQYQPILPVRRADGSYSYIFTDIPSALAPPETPNPIAQAREVADSLFDTRLLANSYAQVTLLKSLTLRTSLGGDYADRGRYTYYPRTTLRGAESNGEAIRADGLTTSWLNENTLNWQQEFGRSNITVLGGFTRQKQEQVSENMTNTQFVSDINGYNDIGAGTQLGGPVISSGRQAWTLMSYLGRVNYGFADRYLLTLTARRDGSSRFGEGKKWGLFPSVAAAWRVSEESFLSGNSTLTDLKLRASMGTVGNPSIRPYNSLARLSPQTYSFNGTVVPGYYPFAVANPELTWETTKERNAGVDVELFNRVTITADAYTKTTRDLLLAVQLPLETGFVNALQNLGSVRNSGVELDVGFQVLQPTVKGVAWRTAANYARNRNRVLDLGGLAELQAQVVTQDFNLPGSRILVGQPIGTFYGFISDGVIRDAADSAAFTTLNFASGRRSQPGELKIRDVAGRDAEGNLVMTPDGRITLDDRTNIGDPTPAFTYGWTNTLSWRRLELTALLQGVHGNKVLNVNRLRSESTPRANILADRYYDRWTPENPDGKYPAIGENPNQVGTNNYTSDLLEDGSFTRLRSLTVAWTLPESIVTGRGFSSARLYLTGSNLITWTKYSGFNPDVSSGGVGSSNRGVDIGAYPLARAVTLGLTVAY
ncbi:MAG: TonB-dependent receptor [Gemmatimonadetes bacterium]|nr:TonB-dependent receptor [Gemmatimonadota bacterium]MCC6773888.1 TonB-dependent receptor [Gemmatimonadaceae bacterium]